VRGTSSELHGMLKATANLLQSFDISKNTNFDYRNILMF